MKPAEFQYHDPDTVDQAVALLTSLGEDAKVIAGGQSLLPIMNLRLAEPEHLVDITGVPELSECVHGHASIRYGAATTHMMFEDGLVPDMTSGLLRQTASGIGYRAIRCRGTVGGSLAHSDSAAEWPTVMSALDATVHLASSRGRRSVPVREFLLGFFTTTLEDDEILTAVEVPHLGPGTRCGLHKLARQPGDFAESLAVAIHQNDEIELWLGAAQGTPTEMTESRQVLADHPTAVSVEELINPVAADLGHDLKSCDLAQRHAIHQHAATVHRALSALEGAKSYA